MHAGRSRWHAVSWAVLLAFLPASSPAQEGAADERASPGEKAALEIAIAEAAGRRVLQLRAHPDFAEASRREPELEASLERAQRLLRAAKSGLSSAERSRSATAYSDASVLARRANQQFADYEDSVRDAFARLEAERSPPPPPPPPPEPVSEPGPGTSGAETTAPGPEPAAGRPETAAVQEGTDVPPLREVPPPPPEPPLARPSSSPPVTPPPSVAPPPRTSSRPPRALSQAADAYFAGEYQQAVDLLSVSNFRQRKARAHALLLRAAARYALFLLDSETDYALRGLATEDVTACRRADPDLVPDPRYFSPRFRDFFAATR